MRTSKILIVKDELLHKKDNVIDQLMTEKGYKKTTYKGESVYKKGKGILTAPSFFKFNNLEEENKIRIEAWIKYAILPGLYVGESDLDSNFGFVVKKPMRNIVEKLYEILSI